MVRYSLSFTAYKAASGGVSLLRCETPRTLQKHTEVGQGCCQACLGRCKACLGHCKACRGRCEACLGHCKACLHIFGTHKNHYNIVYYQLSLFIVNVGKCGHFILLSLYNIFNFFEVVIIYLSLFL